MPFINENLFVQGIISASQDIGAGRDITAIQDIAAGQNVEAGNIVSANVDIGAGHDIVAQHDLTAGNDVNATVQVKPLTTPAVPTGSTTLTTAYVVTTAQFRPGLTVLGTDGNRYTLVLDLTDPQEPTINFVLQP